MAASLKAIMKVQSQWDVDNTAYEAGTMLIIQYDNGNVKFKMADNIHKFNDLAFYGDDQLNLKIKSFTANTEYGTNDIVMYNGDLYLSKTGFTSSSSFDLTNWTRVGTYYTASDVDTKLGDYVTKTSINNDVILSFTPTATNEIFKLSINKKNFSDGNTSSVDVELPAVTSTTRGIATPEMYGTITQHESRINQLEGSSSRYVVDISTYANDADNPTQAELLAAYQGASGNSGNPSDGTILINENNTVIQWQYITSSSTWIVVSNAIPVFSKNAAGTIVGADEDDENDKGKIVSGLDGKGKVNQLTGIISDQIAVDIQKLSLKNFGDQTIIPLENAPYKITSSYGSVECYGKYFIFDQQTVGKGIIRDSATSTFTEVTDLGIYAPSGTINTIHIIDCNDVSVCVLVNEKTQTKTLVIYPDGTYKVCEFTNINRTPQFVTNMRLLTSMDGTRHSLFMYNLHDIGATTNTNPTEYLLFQLEDAQLRILNSSTPECSGFESAGTFNPAINFTNNWFAFEDSTTIQDYESNARNDVDLFRATKENLNARLPYKTGIWQSGSGSPMLNRLGIDYHNGIYGHKKGAMILFPRDTNVQNILITPEGFIGWFQINAIGYEYYRDYRTVEIKSGPYAGKRGIFFYPINQYNSNFIFIVNSSNGDPSQTVCNTLRIDLNNLNHLSGKYPMAAASANMYPSRIYTDYHRIHISVQNDSIAAASRLWHYYINQKDIKPNVYTINSETGNYSFANRNFDICCIDCRLDTGSTSSTWHPDSFTYMERVDWTVNPDKEINNVGTIYRGQRVSKLTFLQNPIATSYFGVKINSLDTYLTTYVRANGAVYVYTGLPNEYTDSTIDSGTTIKVFDGADFSGSLVNVDIGNGITAIWDDTTDILTFSSPLKVFDPTLGIRTAITLDTSYKATLVNHVINNSKEMYGTIVHGMSYNCSLFIPDGVETWDGEFGIRPYFIQHQDNEATSINGYSLGTAQHRGYYNRKAVWNHQLFLGLLNNTTSTAFIRSFYFDFTTARMMSRKVNFAAAACEMSPIVIDDKVMLLLPNNASLNRVVALTKSDNEIGYNVTDGGDFLMPAAGSAGPIFQRAPTNGESNLTPGIAGITFIFDAVNSRNNYYEFYYVDNDGTIVPTWSTYPLPASFITEFLLVMPNGRVLLFPSTTGQVCYNIPPGSNGTSVQIFNENNITGYIYDISNTQNENESSFGCYAIVPQGQASYFYTLEYHEDDRTPVTIKWFKRTTANSRIWALPSTELNGTQLQRFLLGSSAMDASTASNPGTIIERIGGKINDNNPNPRVYTRVRDFGTNWNPETASTAARVDLAVVAGKWYEPHLVPFDNSVVRFLKKKRQTLGDAYTQFQNPMLLGYTYDSSGNYTPFYGVYEKLRETGSDYGPEIEYSDNYVVEVGKDYTRDSMIYFGQENACTLKLADGWKAHDVDTEFSVGTIFGSEAKATIWASYNEGNNYKFRGINNITIENEIIGSSPVTEHVDGQFTHEMRVKPIYTATGGFGPNNSIGFSGFEPIIRNCKIAFIDHTKNVNVANWSKNEGLVIINPNINIPYTALTSAQYTNASGTTIGTYFETTARTPLYQMMDNQIIPGIYRRRNNQDINANFSNGIVPYFQFTDEKCDMIYKDIKNVAWTSPTDPKPFYDEVRVGNTIEEHYDLDTYVWKYKTRELYDLTTGNTVLMCYYIENDISKYKEIILPEANEFMTQLVYLNGYMLATGLSKTYKINVVDHSVIKDIASPDTLTVVAFDLNNNLYSFHSDDNSNLYEFSQKSLVLDYDGNSYYVIPLRDLIVGGNNVLENVSVTNQLVASYARVAKIEADQIFVKSKFQNLVFP
jgi:hypothetical protein